MRKIACISGRSSKGKDSLLSSLAVLSAPVVIVDCSFEYNLLAEILQERKRKEINIPFFRVFSFEEERCSHCRQCLDICHQQALNYEEEHIKYYEYRCSHCGSCIQWCPLMALKHGDKNDVSLVVSENRAGYHIYTESLIEPGLMPEMIRYLREQANTVAKSNKTNTVLINGSRGVNDTSYLALADVDAIVIIVSPSNWALDDLGRDIKLSRLSGVEPLVVANMTGVNREFDQRLSEYCEKKQLTVAGKIPADIHFRESLLHKRTMVEFSPDSKAADAIRMIWAKVNEQIKIFRS